MSVLYVRDKGGKFVPVYTIKGENGKTPYMQDGYWYIDGVNTNVKAEGVDGKDGVDGKTAYEYAKEGGYAGTEAEFISKLAKDYVFDGEYNAVSNKVATVNTVASKTAAINNALSQHGTKISANEMAIAENTKAIDEINDTIFGGADDSIASQGLSYEYNDSSKGYYVTGIGTCTDTDLVIPSEYQGLPVVGIRDHAFSFYPNDPPISSVFVPRTVTQGMYYVFPSGTIVYFEATSASDAWYPDWDNGYIVFWGVSLNSESIVNKVSANAQAIAALEAKHDAEIGDIGSALDELHAYAQNLVSGGAA